MSEQYRKKKQPDVVRARLLEAAAKIIETSSVQGLRLEAVAQCAGVT